ncbi:MAG: FKBP-type peptidyl-prolyl cis-trans isomerase 2 [Myxococcota bacterium]|jgi:FKBP-type peptidyl-prolyl cis-trans isomerase 2
MRVTKNSVVKISYTVAVNDSDIIDESPLTDPFEFYCGAGQLVPGFERALMGLRAGEKKEFTVPASEAYGERSDELIKRVARASLPAHIAVAEGMRIPMRSPEGVELVCKIIKVQDNLVVADFNHPLAGQELSCRVNIIDVRNAN